MPYTLNPIPYTLNPQSNPKSPKPKPTNPEISESHLTIAFQGGGQSARNAPPRRNPEAPNGLRVYRVGARLFAVMH